MRILLVRHGDPDYEHDTLTEKGHKEAALLAETAKDLNVGDCYVSPLGRAQDTASYTLKKLGLTAKTKDWLQEFPAQVDINQEPELQAAYPDCKRKNGYYQPRILWDMVPGYWTGHPEYIDKNGWRTSLAAQYSDLVPVYDYVTENFDKLLEQYGYVRDGTHYRVVKESRETITLFCHFGVSCVILSHLWNLSPFILWHSLALAPSSVTEVVTEEREKGTAYFRGLRVGDLSHLYMGKENPSFAERFCETYGSTEERH